MKTFIYPTYDSKRDKSGNLYIDSFRKAFESDPRFKVCNTWARSETLGLLLNLRASLFILHWVDLIPSKPLGWLQTLFFRAGGIKMAINMPYRPTDRALTTEAGKILPRITPRQVPAAQPGQARAMAP